jgi:hypothetical protein
MSNTLWLRLGRLWRWGRRLLVISHSGLSFVTGNASSTRQKNTPCRNSFAFGGIGRGGISRFGFVDVREFDNERMILGSGQFDLL